MNKFTKADLKPNMIVKLRRGDYAMIYEFEGELILAGGDGWGEFSDYNDNLLSSDDVDFDIVEVKNARYEYHFMPKHWCRAPIIWERKEPPEHTEVERGILESILHYDKDVQ